MRVRVLACLAMRPDGQRACRCRRSRRAARTRPSAATVDGAKVSITYGRPYMRGRKIVGGLVPYGRVWRTGADESTTLTTDAPLVIGGAAVPAGKVSLYTLPGPQGWKLIINKQTGQWGTEYNEAQDLARVDMATKALTAPVDQFTIKIEGGQIKLAWELTEVSVPIKKG